MTTANARAGERIIADLSVCRPASALSRTRRARHWLVVDHETADEEAAWRERQPRAETRLLAQIHCSGILTGHIRGTHGFHPASRDWFRHEIEPCVGNDVGIFIFEAIRGHLCAFRTMIGDVGTADNHWPEAWVDPLGAFTDLGHESGLKVFASMRMIGANHPMQRHPISWARHFFAHQEWAKRDRDGAPRARPSRRA